MKKYEILGALLFQPDSDERRSKITLDKYTSHAQRYRFYTGPAVRAGLLWKIPLDGALRLTTPHFVEGVRGAVIPKKILFVFLKISQNMIERCKQEEKEEQEISKNQNIFN